MAKLKIKVLGVEEAANTPDTRRGNDLYKSFWKKVEKRDPEGATSILEELKSLEPNFKTSKMNKTVTELQKQVDKENEEAETHRQNAYDVIMLKAQAGDLFQKLFTEVNLGSSGFDDVSKIDQYLADYRNKVDILQSYLKEIQTKDEASIQELMQKAERNITEYYLKGNDEVHKKIAYEINQATSFLYAETNYMELLFRQAYWKEVQEIFPQNKEFANAYKSVTAVIKSLGTQEQRKANVEKNEQAQINSRSLPKAEVSDTELENVFKNAFLASCKAKNSNAVFVRTIITSADYSIIRNELTGIVVQRARKGVIVYKKNGKCYYGEYIIYQDFVGNDFVGTPGGYFSEYYALEISCNNI